MSSLLNTIDVSYMRIHLQLQNGIAAAPIIYLYGRMEFLHGIFGVIVEFVLLMLNRSREEHRETARHTKTE